MALDQKQRDEFIREAFDTNKVHLYCSEHMYFGPSKDKKLAPAKNCIKCWTIFYFHEMATTPPHLREQKMEELTEVLRNVVQEVESGRWDLKLDRHAQVKIEPEKCLTIK